MIETQVLIAGGGPVGLTLALELAHRGISTVVVERNETTTEHPRVDVTNGRSMEHFRRLGVAEELRESGVPLDHPMDVVWCSRLAEWELARFAYPSVEVAREITRSVNDGSLPLEPYLRISQVVLEPVLRDLVDAHRRAEVRFGWALDSFEEDERGVNATVRSSDTGGLQPIHASYLVGCDGAGSLTRARLGIELEGASTGDLLRGMGGGGVVRAMGRLARGFLRGQKPPDGRLYLVHFRSKDRPFFERFGTAWQVRSPTGATLVSQNDSDTWTLHVPLRAGANPEIMDPKNVLFEVLGREFDCEVLGASAWMPRLALAKSYGRGRVWLAGDSAHQMIPSGAYGMNTGVGDAMNLGWKLAALLEGWGGPALLSSYETERLPIGRRNRDASARHTSVRMQVSGLHGPHLHEDSPKGESARAKAGEQIRVLGNLENEALGLEIGDRYDGSPVICGESGEAPNWSAEAYTPSTWPGARPPSVFLEDGTALFDRFGPGFTLLRFADVGVERLVDAARERGVPLWVVDLRDDHARSLYERDLVLIRPDQHVAWRGDHAPENAGAVVDRVRGAA